MNSYILQLESLELEYSNKLQEYQHEYANYINLLKNSSSSSKPSFNVITNASFWGSNEIANQPASSVSDCQALCSANANCSGATFNSSSQLCSIRSGISNIQFDSNEQAQINNSAIVKEATSYLINLQSINTQLTNLNNKIINIVSKIQHISMKENENTQEKKVQLMKTYSYLKEERKNIDELLKSYFSVNQNLTNNTIQVKQSDSIYNLLFFIAIFLVIFIITYNILYL
jgi:hypothetical protein